MRMIIFKWKVIIFYRNDELGIPYTVVVEDSSIPSGIVHIRSRDTTLKVRKQFKHFLLMLQINYKIRAILLSNKHGVNKQQHNFLQRSFKNFINNVCFIQCLEINVFINMKKQ